MYVIITKNGAFVEEHSRDCCDLNYVYSSIDTVQKYTVEELNIIHEVFHDRWVRDGFEVFEINYNIGKQYFIK